MRILDRLLIGGALGALGVLTFSSPVVAQEQAGGRIRCESIDGKLNRCQVPWRDAELVTQESRDACIRGQSWGLDRGGVWVDRGCRGQFAETFRDGPRGRDGRDGQDNRDNRDNQDGDHGGGYARDGGDGGWQPGADWNRQIRLQCDSHQNNYQMCQVDVGRRGRVELVKQLSGARCTEGDSWGWNRAGVWVNHGCRGQFVVDRRW
ncbi:MAG: DUF3011 domain-containing protein [Rhodanobacter sp.]